MYSDFFQDGELEGSLSNFEESLRKKENRYFEVHEFEFIIDYYLSTNDLDRAKKALEKAFELHPNSYELKKLKAQWFNFSKEFTKAIQEIETAVASNGNSNDIDYYMIMGEALSGLNQESKATELFKVAISMADKDEYFDITSAIAAIYQQQNKTPKAIKYLKLAIKGDPTLNLDLAFEYQSINNYKQSKIHCKQYLKFQPFAPDAWFLLHHLYMEENDYQSAEDALLNAIAINPTDTMYHYELASFYTINERFIEALEVYKELLELNDDLDINILISMGNILTFLERFDMALSNFQNVLYISPYHPKALVGIAKVKLQQEAYCEAKDLIYQAIEEEPNNPKHQLLLADVLSLENKIEETDLLYQKLIKQYSDFVDVWENYFDFLYFRDNFSGAMSLLKKAKNNHFIELNPNAKMAAIYINLGDYSKAIYHLHLLVSKDTALLLNEFKLYYPNWENISEIKSVIKQIENFQ